MVFFVHAKLIILLAQNEAPTVLYPMKFKEERSVLAAMRFDLQASRLPSTLQVNDKRSGSMWNKGKVP
ncbi:MAG: hypothetical protein CVU39_24905 [Chloroflexi bacterium HGW-Chloroflexi-10]|nr:MAG: hypothetical protein CVU39_24905 [Chloroflexi bacterium HGW-Chloroflexi-10]